MAKNIILFGLLCVCVGLIGANVIVPHTVDCECSNTEEHSHEECINNVAHCSSSESDKASSCFVLWATNNTTGEYTVTMKGCFTDQSCNNTECVDNSNPKKTNFCCCTGHMCNSQFKLMATTTKAPEIEELAPPQKDINILVVVMICCGIAFVASVLFAGVYFYKSKKNALFNEIPTNEPDLHALSQAQNEHRPIQLLEVIASGRFGVVWRAKFRQDDVAVKVVQEEKSWETEQRIFMLPRMNHPNILEFIGGERHLDQSSYWLITAYHSYGSLCEYLKAHTVTWAELCKIAESMARGLMHLHEEIPASKTEKLKPAVAHLDFKSKNVLLKSDLTACIADFGLAVVFQPDVPCGDTYGQVGTRRYMAPEVLEGAISFTRDAFLRIDVYACAMVLWELASRCTAHGGEVAEYALPFETELKLHPTMEELQEFVVMKKQRPVIAEHWRAHSGLNAICDTIEECWEHDPEARLTAPCIVERVAYLTRYTKTALLIETNSDTPLIKNTSE